MRLRVIVFGAIGAIEVALIGQVNTALQRFAVEKTLTGFEKVIAGKFAADLLYSLHAACADPAISVATIPYRRKNGHGKTPP